MNPTAVRILDRIRNACCVSVGEVQTGDPFTGEQGWLVEAVSADGFERWRATGPTYYLAVCALAELMGFDLRDD